MSFRNDTSKLGLIYSSKETLQMVDDGEINSLDAWFMEGWRDTKNKN